FDPAQEEAQFKADLARIVDNARATVEHRTHDDSDGALVGFALMALCALGFVVTRGNAVRRTFATSRRLVDIELDVLKRVARIHRTRVAWFAAVCGVALYATTKAPLSPGVMFVLGTTELLTLGFAMFVLCRLQILIGLRAEPSLRVVAHGPFLFAARGNRLIDWVGASPSLLSRATPLPTAAIRR
ncbi:MAG TPA: hypothetical protein VIV11_04930, partial [Kofleriaceae bacterium]